ncbi:MAG: sulfite exporter TauE/SafE family protein [Lawsonibacter sp.]|jgi:uncharacterized membrane protein YfcA|nr:sulfite exporter TauE/SafE family protein [Lawsonibacter sp.]
MEYLIIGLSAVVAGVIQNIAGFGAGIILMLILPHFFNMLISPAINAAICTGMTIILAVHYRKYTDYKRVWLPCVCFMAMSVSIIWVVSDIDLHLLGAAFGVFLIALSIYFIFFQKNIKVKPTAASAVCFGLLAGALSGLFSIGATAMALYFLAISRDRNVYIGNLQTLLAINNVVSLLTRALRGIYTADLILPTAVGFAGILLGQFFGSKIAGKLDAAKINLFIYILVGVSGIETLIKQLAYLFL